MTANHGAPMALTDRLSSIRRVTGAPVAGVSAGIAREFRTDPVIVRIAFVVLTLFGFAGGILYLACWAMIPKDGEQRGPVGRLIGLGPGERALRGYGLAAVAVLALVTLASGWGFGHSGTAVWIAAGVALVALPVAIVAQLIAGRAPEPAPAMQSKEFQMTASDPPAAPTSAGTLLEPPVGPPGAPLAPARAPWSPALFLMTMSAVAVALGGLWLANVLGASIAPDVFAATALALVTLGLFVGTRVGNAGLLIPVGIVTALALMAASVVSDLPSTTTGDRSYSPLTAAAVTSPEPLGAGRITVDLTKVSDPANLAGQEMRIRVGVGQTTVVVPADLPVSVDAKVRVGDVSVFGRNRSNQRVTYGRAGDFRIVIIQSVGEIEVEHP